MRNYKTKLRLNDVNSVNNLMARVINSLIDETITESDARAFGYLANILYKGLEQLENQGINKEQAAASIEHLQAKTDKIRAIGGEFEDMSEVIKLVYES